MSKSTKMLFQVADFFAWIGTGGAIFYFFVSFLMLVFLSLSDFAANSYFSELIVSGWLGLLVELVIAALLSLGFYLHIKRQVLGVALILPGLAIRSLVLSLQLEEIRLVMFATSLIAAIFLIPWTMAYLEVKRLSR